MSDSLRKKLILGLALGLLVYIVFVFLGDVEKVLAAGSTFPWHVFPVLLVLAFGNYLVRLARWNYYLRSLRIGLPAGGRAVVFFAGLVMSITPGKVGELLKAQYVRNIDGTPRRRTGSAVLAERITDLVGVLVLSSFGVFQLQYGEVIFFACLVVILGGLAVAASRRLSLGIIAFASRIPFVGERAHKLEEAYESVASLLRPGPLLLATIISVLAWGCECVGYFVVMNSFPGIELGLGHAVFIYAFATLVGAVTMLPGGLGITEGTMTGLMILLALPPGVAVAGTMITRFGTLWFAVLIGMVTTVVWRRLLEGTAAGAERDEPAGAMNAED